MAKQLAKMYRDIYKEKGMPKGINKPVTATFAKKLWSGVVEGYGKDMGNIAYDSPDYGMLANLQKNVYAFSAAKNYQQMKAITQALVSDDGNGLKTWSEFRVAANDITGEHLRWLKVEYDTAIAGGQMASKWVGIESNKGSLPMLEFDAVMDRRTSALCSSLNGVVRPVDDSFWNQYYPPNHFGCRSTVRQRGGGRSATPLERIEYPEKMPEMFKVNLAKLGLIYPKGSNYFIGIPQSALKEGESLILNPQFSHRLEGKNGGFVDVHENMDINKRERLIESSKLLAEKGNQIQLLPEIPKSNLEDRKRWFPELDKNNFRNPDARFNNLLGDFKLPDSQFVHKGVIQNAIKATSKKKVNVCGISLLGKEYSRQDVLSQIKGSLANPANHKTITEVWIIFNDRSVLKIPRGIIANKNFYKIIATL